MRVSNAEQGSRTKTAPLSGRRQIRTMYQRNIARDYTRRAQRFLPDCTVTPAEKSAGSTL